MKKGLLNITIFLPLLLTSTGCNGHYTLPTFTDNEGICITGYAAPTVENWNGTQKNVENVTLEVLTKAKEAGFNKMIALYEGCTGTASTVEDTLTKRYEKAEKDAMKFLEIAEQVGIKYYVRDWDLYGITSASEYCGSHEIDTYEEYLEAMRYILPDDVQYLHSSACAGNFVCDEPFYSDLDKVKWVVQAYLERLRELGITDREPLINLLPISAGSSAMNGHTYAEYVEKYAAEIGSLLGYISYDFYPFLSTEGSYIKTTYLANLEKCATLCKENNLQLRVMMQDKSDFTGMREMTSIGDFRLQMYTNLAFGASDITYYEYSNFNSYADGDYALYNNQNGTYNWTYEAAKIVNNEVHQFENAIMSYSWDGVMYNNANELYDNQNFMNLVNPLSSHKRVKIVETSEDTLLTTFKHKKTGDDAFMVVNFKDPYYGQNDTVTLKFSNARGLLMYRYGQQVIVDLPLDGTYTMVLSPGEGRFIIPLR